MLAMRRMLALAVAIAFCVLVMPSPASAHGQLAYSDPANQSTITEPRAQLALYFTERPASLAFFSVTAPDGMRVDQGWTSGEPKPLSTPVQELNLKDGKWEPVFYNTGFPAMVGVSHYPSKGVYTVRYVTVASDGDKVSGDIRFDYQGATTAAPAGWQPPTNQPAAMNPGAQPPPGTPGATQTLPAPQSSSRWPVAMTMAAVMIGLAVVVMLRRRRSVGGR